MGTFLSLQDVATSIFITAGLLEVKQIVGYDDSVKNVYAFTCTLPKTIKTDMYNNNFTIF